LISIYKDREDGKLRHQINLSEVTAVARQKDPKRQGKHVFGIFSPSRNFHLEASSDQDAQDWVEAIRREARMDEQEEEMFLASPGGANTAYRGFERSIDANLSPSADERTAGYSSSDAEAFGGQSQPMPKGRTRMSRNAGHRKSSHLDYSGAEHGSYSDFSDGIGPSTARMSALSLSHTDPRPSTSSNRQTSNPVYGSTPARPLMGARNPSQVSGLPTTADDPRKSSVPEDPERVIYHGWTYLLKSKSGVRQWKKVWCVLRPKAFAVYKDEHEYTPIVLIPFASIIDAVEIDNISKTKTACMQVISEERNYRFCAMDEESLARCLGAFKSLLARRKAAKTVQPVAATSGVAS
jgi:hypothetical protein